MGNTTLEGGCYVPSEESLKFIAFLRATGNEENISPEAHYKIADVLFSSDKKDWKVVIECLRGLGKLQTARSPILTPTGWTTMGKIQLGDKVITRSGKAANVKWKTAPQHPKMFKMLLTDGTELEVGDNHLHIVERRTSYLDAVSGKCKTRWQELVLTTTELLGKTLFNKNKNRTSTKAGKGFYTTRIPLISNPVEFDEQPLSNSPYVMGLMLADGYFNKGIISLHADDLEYTTAALTARGYTINSIQKTSVNGYKINIGSLPWKAYKSWVFNSKHIPDEYMYNTVANRLELLRGLMDGDGSLAKNGSSRYHSKNKRLADNVKELVQSLGGISYVKKYERPKHADGNPEYTVTVNMRVCPFSLGRKADRWKPTTKQYKYVVSIEEYEEAEEGYCIGVDSPCESYITKNYTVTHNSTVVEYAFIYIAALGYWPNFGKVPFVVFLGASQDGNVKSFFKNVAGKIVNSVFLSQLFKLDNKNFRQIDNEIELTNQDGVVTIAAGRGMSTNWRGIRSRTGKRPTVLIADDVLPNDVMTSETIRKTIETNWFNSALPALDPMKHKIIYIGTPLSEVDLLHQLKNSGAYTVIRFPLCPKFPVPENEFESIWPDRFTYTYTKDLFDQYKAAGTTQSFYTEFMLEITDLSTLLVEEEDIQWFDPSQLAKHRGSYNFYIVTDFATSTKKSADFSTIGVVALSSNNDWLLVDGQCLRQTMQENIDDLFKYVKKWKPLSVGIESSGQQGGFISILQEMMVSRNIWFTFAKKPGSKDPGIRPIKDKVHRFVTGVQPKFKQNKIWLPKPELAAKISPRLYTLVEEMLHELSKLTLAGGTKALAHDDAIDLWNQLSEIDLYAPTGSEELTSSVITDDGLVWTSVWGDEEEPDGYANNVIF